MPPFPFVGIIIKAKECEVRGVAPREVFMEEIKMDKEMQMRKASFDLTDPVYTDMIEFHSDLMEDIRCLLTEGSGKLNSGVLELINYVIVNSSADEDFKANCAYYLNRLRYAEKNGNNIIWDDDFRIYCYLMQTIVFETVNKGYRGGVSYEEFIHRVLKKNGLAQPEWRKYIIGYDESPSRKKIFENKGQEKLLADNFKKYLSDFNKKQQDYIKAIKAYRGDHDAVRDKNQNGGEYLFPPIADYEVAEYEFEFYMKKKNHSSKLDNDLLEEIIKLTEKRLGPYFKTNMDFYLKKYRKILNKKIRERNRSDAEVLSEVVRQKIAFIDHEESDIYKRMGIWNVLNQFGYNIQAQMVLLPDLELFYFQSMSDVLLLCYGFICNESVGDAQRKKLWHAILNAGNLASSIIDQQHVIWGNMYPPLDYEQLAEYWKREPRNHAMDAKNKIQINFLDPLKRNDRGMREFINLALLLHDAESADIDIEILVKSFKAIFGFLTECKQKSITLNSEKILNIRLELGKLEKQLESLGMNISFDEFENSRTGYSIKTYFGKRYENRYQDLMYAVEQTSGKGGFCSQMLIGKYLNMVLKTEFDSWLEQDKEESELDRKLCSNLYDKIFSLMYPNEVETKDMHEKKQQILDFAEKYRFKNDF